MAINRANYIQIGKQLQNALKGIDITNRPAFTKKFIGDYIAQRNRDGAFKRTVDEMCQLAVDTINANTKAQTGAMKQELINQQRISYGEKIFFEVHNKDEVFNESWGKIDENGKIKGTSSSFMATGGGLMGTFFEALFLGKKGDPEGAAVLPDIEDILECKTSSDIKGNIHVGGYISEWDRAPLEKDLKAVADEGFIRAIGILKMI